MERVYVANLPPDIRIKDIDDFFRPFGKLVYIDVNHRANPVYAFVQFDSARNAFNAVKARHGYDYEGYTLQLRLVENEVRKRRDATPPAPPPPVFNSFDRQNSNGFGNNYSSNRMIQNYSGNSSNSQWSTNNRSDMEQFPTTNRHNMRDQNINFSSSNRSNMQQSNMMPYSSGSRPNMEQQFSNTLSRSNMQPQFSSTSRSNMSQQYSSFNRSNIQQQYSMSRSNMPQLNNFDNHSDMANQNMAPYSSGLSNMQQQLPNLSRSNIPQLQNMNIQYPETRNGMGWNTGNFGNDNFVNNSFGNVRANSSYNPDSDPYTKKGFEDKFTMGLSGSGRKWFNRYIRQGFSPEKARAKALEHRKLPYLRGEAKSVPNDPTNAALESIGNTIISILSSNPNDNMQSGFCNNMGGGNIHMPGPRSTVVPQANPISKRQYIKSLDILKVIKGKREKSSKDRISLKYHTQIVKDYEKFNKVGSSRNESGTSRNITSGRTEKGEAPKKAYRDVISTRSEKQVSELIIKEKAKLLKKAREYGSEKRDRKRFGGAYKKRTKILMNHGFLEMEAKSLAWNPLHTLEELLSLKSEYDLLAKKTVFIPASKASLANAPKAAVYRNDLQHLEEYAKHRIKGLSKTILYGLTECLKRIHEYEKSKRIPLTENKFTRLLLKITSREDFFKNMNKTSSRKKKPDKTTIDKKDVEGDKKTKLEEEVNKAEVQDDANVAEDDHMANEDNIVKAENNDKEEEDEANEEGNEEVDNEDQVIEIEDNEEEHLEAAVNVENEEDEDGNESAEVQIIKE